MRMFSLASAAFALALYAGAEETTPKPTPDSAQAEQDGAPVGSPVQTAGKVISMHNCPMVGVSDPHTLVKIETEKGDTDIVDLGSTAELKTSGIEPKEGQKLWVDGRVGKVNDKFLIVAERLSESKLVLIARTSPLREETVKHAEARTEGKGTQEAKAGTDTKDPKTPKTITVDAGQQIRTVEGTVMRSRKVNIEGETGEHVVVKLQTESGTAVVDLGLFSAIPNTVDLKEGNSIAATGYVGQLNGKPIIVADTVGNLNRIQRTVATETIPTSNPTTIK